MLLNLFSILFTLFFLLLDAAVWKLKGSRMCHWQNDRWDSRDARGQSDHHNCIRLRSTMKWNQDKVHEHVFLCCFRCSIIPHFTVCVHWKQNRMQWKVNIWWFVCYFRDFPSLFFSYFLSFRLRSLESRLKGS